MDLGILDIVDSERARAERRLYTALDSCREDLDAVVTHAARATDCPIALVTLLQAERQVFLASHGLDLEETPLDWSFCRHAVTRGKFWVVTDAPAEPIVANSPFVCGPLGIRFYAGATIDVPGHGALGTVCVLDTRPREAGPEITEAVLLLARHVSLVVGTALSTAAASSPAASGEPLEVGGPASESQPAIRELSARTRRTAALYRTLQPVHEGAALPSKEDHLLAKVLRITCEEGALSRVILLQLDGASSLRLVAEHPPHRSEGTPDSEVDRVLLATALESLSGNMPVVEPQHHRAIFPSPPGLEVRLSLIAWTDRPSLFDAGKAALLTQVVGDLAHAMDVQMDAQRHRRLGALEALVLQAILADQPLSVVFATVVRGVEGALPGVRCTVMQPDLSGERLCVAAAPSFDPRFHDAIHARPIKDRDTACANAFLLGERVIVLDADLRPEEELVGSLSRAHGFRAVWSLPVPDPRGEVAAVFGFFCSESRPPSARDERLLENAIRLAGLAIEYHRRKRELDARDELLARFFSGAATGLAMTDMEGRFLLTNRAYQEMLGFSCDELRAKRVLDLTHPEDRQRNGECIAALLSGHTPSFIIEKRYIQKSGQTLWARVSVAMSRDGQGRPSGFVAVIEDIHARRASAVALERANALVGIAGRVARIGGWSVTLPDAKISWSNEVCEIHGVAHGYVPGLEEAIEFYVPEDRERIRDHFARCASEGTPFDLTCTIRSARGELVEVRAIGEAARNEAGEITAVQGAFQDIGEQRRTAQRLSRSEALLRIAGRILRVGGLELDFEHDSVSLSDEVCTILARPPGNIVSTEDWLGCFPPRWRPAVAASCRVCAKLGHPFDMTVEIDLPDGGRRWVRFIGEGPTHTDGRERLVRAAFWDVTTLVREEARQREHQAFLRTAAETARLGGWSYDESSGQLTMSDETRRLFELNEAPTTLAAFYAMLEVPGDAARFERALSDCIAGRGVLDLEVRVATGRELPTWMRARGRCFVDPQDGRRVVRGAMQDVHENHLLQEESLRLAAHLSMTLDSITDPFLVLGRANEVVYANAQAGQLLGSPRESMIGMAIGALMPAERAEELTNQLVRARQTAETAQFAWHLEGPMRHVEVTIYPSAEGAAIHLRDVTARRLNEERLEEQAALIERAHDAIFVMDMENRVLFWNRSAERLYGCAAPTAIGREAVDLLHGRGGTFEQAIQRVRDFGEWTGELEHEVGDGKRIIAMARWSLVRDRDGRPRSILAIHTDITETRQLEIRSLRAQRLESIGTLAGGIAHDLNNVLAPILMTASAIQSEVEDATTREDLGVIVRSAERGARMVQQLLMFARGGDGQLARVHTGAVAHEVFRLMRDTLPKSIGVRLEVEDGLWDVYADVTQLHQVLTNLAVNARDAMEHGGHLTIGAKMVRIDHTYAAMNPNARPGHYVSLWVDDTGCGMPKAVIDRIFEPFFTTKEVGRGTGLGLSTVHAIVRGHGGFINVYSEQGRGSRFHVYIPALPPTADATSLPEVSAVLARYRGKGQLILVVDDEDPVRVTASRTLVRYGYRVLEAKNGAEAIAEYAQHWRDIDMVLTDMAMPILDGPSAIIAMRAINPRVRVVGSSGLRARASPRGAELEVEYFLQKPYSAESLLRTLAQVLDRDQARPGGADLAFQMDGP